MPLQQLGIGGKRTFRRRKRVPMKKRLAKMERKFKPEIKWAYLSNHNATDGTTIAQNTAATPLLCYEIASGANINQRVGNRIFIKDVNFKMFLANNNAFDVGVRLTIFWWKGDTQPALSDVFIYPGAGAGQPDPTVTPVNQVNVRAGYLKIMYDKVIFLETNAQPDSGFALNSTVKVNKYSTYTDTGASDIRNGLYYVLSSTSAVSTSCSDNCIVRYTDV